MTTVTEWGKAHEPAEDLIWKKGMWDQIVFFRDQVHPLFVPKYEDREARPVTVAGEHTSKSVLLPVMCIETEDFGIWYRDNFFNHVVSVLAKRPVVDQFLDLLSDKDRTERILPIYAEGFREWFCFGSFASDPKQFTVTLSLPRCGVWTFFWLMTRQAGIDSRRKNDP